MNPLPDRFRRWYDYERDCNAKTLEMLASVPEGRRDSDEFRKAVGKMAHLVTARCRWLHRLGHWPTLPELFPSGIGLTDLAAQVTDIEAAWIAYLSQLDEKELTREFEWQAADGRRYRWDVEGLLTQVHGHAFYHRGQIAQIVAALGGKAVDTDYLFWCKLPPIDPPV